MKITDSIENIIVSHTLPVDRGKQPIKEFLAIYYKEYIEAIESALISSSPRELRDECYLLLEQNLPVIKELCNDIISIYDLYDGADIAALHVSFDKMMRKIEKYLIVDDSAIVIEGKLIQRLYRVRGGTEDYSRIQMFHIPMDKRHLIKSYRYSIPGYPCLYLANGVELCWFECGMPKKFSYSAFDLQVPRDKRLKLINFCDKPFDLASSLGIWYYNYPDQESLIDYIVTKYFVIHPLRTACSVQVNNKNVPFIQEYIFPQLLLLWVRQSDSIDGIQYSSCSSIENAHSWQFENIVLPAKKLKDGYCERLRSIFKLSSPVKVDLSTLFQGKKLEIERIRDFTLILEEKMRKGYSTYLFRELLSLCKTFLQIYSCLSTDNYFSGEVLYQAIDTLNLMSGLITANIESLREKAIEDVLESEKSITIDEFNNTIEYYITKVRPVIFDFWNYASLIRTKTNIDESSYEFV